MPSRPVPPRRRNSNAGGKRKRSKRKKKNAISTAALVPVIVISVIVLVGVGAVFFFDVPGKVSSVLSKTSGDLSDMEWPPTPREDPVGDSFDEPVADLTEKTIFAPLQRRSIDPWFKFSNLQVSFDSSSSMRPVTLTFDIEKVYTNSNTGVRLHAKRVSDSRINISIPINSSKIQAFLRSKDKKLARYQPSCPCKHAWTL